MTMGLLKKGITILNFDETYIAQRNLQKYSHDNLNFQQMKHVNLYCEEDSLIRLNRLLQKRSQKGITFIGSGNYHYVTSLLLKEITKPFTLVLFDNHPDLGTDQDQYKNMLSCGSWVSYAFAEIPLLQKVVIIGPTTVMPRHSTDSRVIIFPFDGNHHYSLKTILSVIHTQNIYISIDKDVLTTSEVETNWDQGMMGIDTLTQYLEYILKHKQAEGVDICGEALVSPVSILLTDYQTTIRKNEKANLNILQTCLKTSNIQTKGA